MKLINSVEVLNISFDVLYEVAIFCEENNLKYSLAFGTLLGAIRHKGMIPWDYDIDLMMPREDYISFFKFFNNRKSTKKNSIKGFCHESDSLYKGKIGRVYVTNTMCEGTENSFINYGRHINIEIYPLDKIPTDVKNKVAYLRKAKTLMKAYKNFYKINEKIELIKQSNGQLSMNIICKLTQKIINLNNILNRIEGNCRKYELLENANLTCLVDDDLCKWEIAGNSFEYFEDVEFEKKFYHIIFNYNEFLKQLYGDWMKYPSEEEISKSMKLREDKKYYYI